MWPQKMVIDKAHVMSLNVVDLKKLCTKYELPASGMKANLRNRILEYLKSGKSAQENKSTVVSTKQRGLKVLKKEEMLSSHSWKAAGQGKSVTEVAMQRAKKTIKMNIGGWEGEVTVEKEEPKVVKSKGPIKRKKKRVGLNNRRPGYKSKAVKRQMRPQRNYQTRQVQKKDWKSGQRNQNWSRNGGRGYEQERKLNRNGNRGPQQQQGAQSWLFAGSNVSRGRAPPSKKRSLFIRPSGANKRPLGEDRSRIGQSRGGWQNRKRGNNNYNGRAGRR